MATGMMPHHDIASTGTVCPTVLLHVQDFEDGGRANISDSSNILPTQNRPRSGWAGDIPFNVAVCLSYERPIAKSAQGYIGLCLCLRILLIIR